MDHPGKRFKSDEKEILTGFLLSAAVIIFFLVITFFNLVEALRSSHANNKVLAQMAVLEKALDEMQDLETLYRGYVITNDTAFLQPAESSLAGINSQLETIRSIEWSVTDTGAVKLLASTIEKKVEICNNIIFSIKNNQHDHAVQLVSSGDERMLMKTIRNLIITLENKGRIKLRQQSGHQPEVIRLSFTFFCLLSLILLLFLTWTWRRLKKGSEEKARIENEVSIANQRIADLYDHAPCGYFCLDHTGKITEINGTEANWLGYPKNELMGRMMIDFITENDRPAFKSFLSESMGKNHSVHFETSLKVKNGNLLPVINLFTFENKNNICQARAAVFDQREIKDVKNQLQSLALMIEYSWDAIATCDSSFIITSWNKGAEAMYGYTKEEALGRHVAEITKTSNTDDDRKHMVSEMLTNNYWNGEIIHYRKDGTPLPVQLTCTLILNNDKTIRGILAISKVTNTEKLKDENLKIYNRELERMVTQRTREAMNILERISDGFIAFDKRERIIYVNQYAGHLLGIQSDALIGENAEVFFESIRPPELGDKFRKEFHSASPAEFEIQSAAHNWLNLRFYSSLDGVSVFIQDITVRKEFESQITNSELKYRLLFNSNPLPMWVLAKTNYRYLDVNVAAIHHYGYSREEFLDKTSNDIRDDAEQKRLDFAKVTMPPSQVDRGVWRHQKKNGEFIDMHIYSHEILYDNTDAWLVMAFDVTKQLNAERDLVEFNRQLKNLTHHLETVREEERASLAREVHDELGQLLTGLKMDISAIRKRTTANEQVTDKVNSAMNLVDLTVATVRKIASSLRPAILDDLGIEAALEWQCIEFSRRSGIECYFENKVNVPLTIGEHAVILLRVCQESLTNITRHAHATWVRVVLEINGGNLYLSIEDNGTGFHTEVVKVKGTLGLVGMRERLDNVNGSLSITSQPGRGTRIIAKLPV